MEDVQKIATGDLLEQYRKILLSVGRNNESELLTIRRANQLEEEILRRMAW